MASGTALPPPEHPFKYELEERVLCFHNRLLYEAKCLKRVVIPNHLGHNQHRYYVHYNGWNKNWDEWVDENMILELNQTNTDLQQELRSKQTAKEAIGSAKRRKAGQTMGAKETGNQSAPNETKRAKNETKNGNKCLNDNNNYTNVKPKTNDKTSSARLTLEVGLNCNKEFVIEIPDQLKPSLIDDWDLITRQKKLFDLPAKTPIDTILDDYIAVRVATNGTNGSAKQVMDSIRDFFNAIIGTQLLYKFERIQYKELLQERPQTRMTSLYGSFHLLRLFTKVNPLLTSEAIDGQTAHMFCNEIKELLNYLSQNSSLFTTNHYSNASPEYCRKTL